MRILHVLNALDVIGNGIINAAVDIACVQARLGHDVAIASPAGSYDSLIRQNSIEHFELTQDKSAVSFPKAVLKFRKIVRTFRPEVVHCHMMTSMLIAKAGRVGKSYQLFSHLHNPHQRSAILMGLADCTIAVSEAVAQQMRKRGISAKKIRVVPNRTVHSFRNGHGSDTPRIELQQPAIVAVAGMFRHKNIQGLIDAFDRIAAEFPTANLYLVGDGPDLKEFQEQAQKSSFSSRIHFEGFQSEPRKYMREAYLFVLPSHVESFGLVVHEAREEGAAIIATRVGGIPEALDHGQAGILVPPSDTEALAEAMRSLLSDEYAAKLWNIRSQLNLEEKTVWQMGKQILALYQMKNSNRDSTMVSV